MLNSKQLPPAHPYPMLANVYQASPFRPATEISDNLGMCHLKLGRGRMEPLLPQDAKASHIIINITYYYIS
jgi:hypothetical protein